MFARHPSHVVVVVRPVDGYTDVLVGVDARLTGRGYHHLVLFVPDDGDDFAIEFFHNVRGQGLVVLVGPKHFPVVRGYFWGPRVEIFVAWRGGVVGSPLVSRHQK